MNREVIRSIVLTFLVTFGATVLAEGFEFTQATLIAAAVTAIRTAVSALLPGGSFGAAVVATAPAGIPTATDNGSRPGDGEQPSQDPDAFPIPEDDR